MHLGGAGAHGSACCAVRTEAMSSPPHLCTAALRSGRRVGGGGGAAGGVSVTVVLLSGRAEHWHAMPMRMASRIRIPISLRSPCAGPQGQSALHRPTAQSPNSI